MHDRNGTELQVGDRVLIEGKITALSGGEEYCNVTVETLAGRVPDGAKETFHAINTGVLSLVERPTKLAAASIG